MQRWARRYLLGVGAVAAAGSMLHLAIPLGGPDWYAFFGAPPAMVELARSGHVRAPLTCAVIAAILAVVAAYAVSGAGLIRRLPLLRAGLAAIAAVLLLRGVLFVPLILWWPGSLARICECARVDFFIVATSVLCLLMGAGYAVGAVCSTRRPAGASDLGE